MGEVARVLFVFAGVLFVFAVLTVFVWIDNRRPAEARLRAWHRVVLLGLVFAGLAGLPPGRTSILLVLGAVLGIVFVLNLNTTKKEKPDR